MAVISLARMMSPTDSKGQDASVSIFKTLKFLTQNHLYGLDLAIFEHRKFLGPSFLGHCAVILTNKKHYILGQSVRHINDIGDPPQSGIIALNIVNFPG